MPYYRRWRQLGSLCYFTLVTEKRRPFLTTDPARQCLHDAFEKTKNERPFEIVAIVLLPDHLHTIWRLPDGDEDYSTRWNLVKRRFTIAYLRTGVNEATVSMSKRKKRERGIWQRRFWEHQVRDDDDFERKFDYIHWNPVKHGYVQRVIDWPWSSCHRYVASGHYAPHWGEGEIPQPNAAHLGGDEFE